MSTGPARERTGGPGTTREGQIAPDAKVYAGTPGTGMPSRTAPGPARSGARRRRRRGDPNAVVPDAEFTSYYGRPVVKASPWTWDIPAYLFLGGVAGTSALLGEGGRLTGRPALRRSGRISSLVGIAGSFYFLVHDLGRPAKFYNMLRIAKPTSPMSMGTWLLTAFGPAAGLAAASEVVGLIPRLLPRPLARVLHAVAGPAAIASAVTGPLVATYTAVLLSDTATPAWFTARRQLPMVFAGSALAAGGGLALATTPVAQSGPARVLAVAGAAVELGVQRPMRTAMGISADTLDHGTAGRWHRASRGLTAGGAVLAAVSRRSRVASAVAGAALLGGSLATRFAIFDAGQASAKDPRYTVVPQRERADARAAA